MEGRCIGAPEGILIAGVAWSVVMPLAGASRSPRPARGHGAFPENHNRARPRCVCFR